MHRILNLCAAGQPARRATGRAACLAALLALLAACAAPPPADPYSDAPETAPDLSRPVLDAPSYAEALRVWRNATDVNAWIGARFQYDPERALLLSETQRERGLRLPITEPALFFAHPRGVCIDLARFGVETLRRIDPAARASYVMIEFDPRVTGGQVLRRHWVAGFERDGQHYYFADSKRPGHIAGPYTSTQQYIAEYARYRGRPIVAWQERLSYERQLRQASRAQALPPQPRP